MTTKNSPVTDAMVTRFLSWELPTTFAPDCYVSFDRNAALRHDGWPTGTNLLHAGQARAMLEHVLGADVAAAPIDLGEVTGTAEPAPDLRPKPAEAQAATGETNAEQQHRELVAPDLPTKVTLEQIKRAIVAGRYDIIPGTQITVCTLTLRNGAKVVGVNYGSIDPDKQDWEQGKNAAYEAAREKVWELEGYLVRQRLHEAKQGGAA